MPTECDERTIGKEVFDKQSPLILIQTVKLPGNIYDARMFARQRVVLPAANSSATRLPPSLRCPCIVGYLKV
jgi:hypothetical protein